MKEDIINMVKYCKCEDCKEKNKCNGIDLMNCYAEKRLTIN